MQFHEFPYFRENTEVAHQHKIGCAQAILKLKVVIDVMLFHFLIYIVSIDLDLLRVEIESAEVSHCVAIFEACYFHFNFIVNTSR